MKPCEIGVVVSILKNKSWGKIPIGGRLRSKNWWQNHLQELINFEEDPIPSENLWDGKTAEEIPVPFEIEFNMPQLDYKIFAQGWKNMMSKQRN